VGGGGGRGRGSSNVCMDEEVRVLYFIITCIVDMDEG
jgi:hypothetical protein